MAFTEATLMVPGVRGHIDMYVRSRNDHRLELACFNLRISPDQHATLRIMATWVTDKDDIYLDVLERVVNMADLLVPFDVRNEVRKKRMRMARA